jgi:tetratricopeptide (TPR) repeat protein
MAKDAFAYRAFISYSHADKACADWLHRELEAYRIPSKLVGTKTGVGEVPARLAPIFRDRDELPAAGDLSEELQKALERSRFLIVIASAAAAQSRWVDEEVRQFKRMHGEGSVLALIAGGVAGDAGGETFFPPSLRFKVGADGLRTDEPAEPIAADLRENGDGKRLAKLKLVAGLTGLPLDALVQREAARRQRKLAAAAVFAGVLAVTMSVLALTAVRGQAEAERQRAEADGLVEFMLTDLRAKLEPVGRLEIFDAVGQRALDYYSRQNLKALDADALGRRARALHLVGEVRELRGDSEGALASFQAAGDTTAELLARHPGDGQRIYDHAQSVFWIGYIAWQRNQMDVAEREFRAYDELASELVAMDPGNDDWQVEKSSSLTNLGVLLNQAGRHAEAAANFRQALAMSRARAAAVPANRDRQRDLGQAHAWLADALSAAGDFPGAKAERESELAAYADILAGDPLDASALEGEAVAKHHLALLYLYRGDYDAAVEAAREGHERILALRRQDPENRLWQDIGVSLANRYTESLMLAGHWDQAADVNAAALVEAKALVATDPTVASWRTSGLMGARWMQVALTFRRDGRAAGRADLARFNQEFAADRSDSEGGNSLPWIMMLALEAMDLHLLGDSSAARERVVAVGALLPSQPQPREQAVLEFLQSRITPQDSSAPPRIGDVPAPTPDVGYHPGALLEIN